MDTDGLAGIDLNLVLALDALLGERNVTQAAIRLGVGQPAMSASLARLRQHFDDPLLVREGRNMVATPVAESLAPIARAAVDSLQGVFHRPRGFDPLVDSRSFRIMVSDYVTMVLLKPLIVELAQDTPLQRAIVVPVQRDFPDQIARGQVDLLIIPSELPGVPLSLAHRHLFSDRFVLIADENNAAVRDGISAAEFADLPYVTYSGGWMDSFADVQLGDLGVVPRIELSTEGFVIAPFLVADSPFVSLVHERLANRLAGPMRLKTVDPPVPLRPVNETMFWRHRYSEDPAHSWWRERIGEFADRL